MRPRRLPLPDRGFTILEILMATAILSLGLVGILALFPVAIDSGKKVMERSTAVTIAKSVAEAIRSGIRNQKRVHYVGEEPCTYFVFQHDGVKDPLPKDRNQERPEGDYYILLPQFRMRQGALPGANEEAQRTSAVAASPEFVYPEIDEPRNGGGDPYKAHDDGKDMPGGKGIVVKKVFSIGNLLPDADSPAELTPPDQIDDPFKQYSFAFSIRASEFDSNVVPPGSTGYRPGNNLYHVRIMVFRSYPTVFNEEKFRAEGKWPNDPIYDMDFEVAK
jgi:prepilin-type N-terminal cleavage/methylation domain-containing protein